MSNGLLSRDAVTLFFPGRLRTQAQWYIQPLARVLRFNSKQPDSLSLSWCTCPSPAAKNNFLAKNDH